MTPIDSSSRQCVLEALAHRQPARVPIDFGGSFVSAMHVSAVAALRDYYGLEKKPVRVIDPGQMLGELDEELKQLIGIDTEGVSRRRMEALANVRRAGGPGARRLQCDHRCERRHADAPARRPVTACQRQDA